MLLGAECAIPCVLARGVVGLVHAFPDPRSWTSDMVGVCCPVEGLLGEEEGPGTALACRIPRSWIVWWHRRRRRKGPHGNQPMGLCWMIGGATVEGAVVRGFVAARYCSPGTRLCLVR
ncbi:hypothetical protein CPB84DRAFT_1803731 [Gymnopilus junonius]|uniref:Uncharacterized protein n=1 Tax=Gymnopilus junonius TaxID=109634 RepID=A0A9P5TFI5_GYMJU|nr:hypothetical protein CPB84DRAFT_1803731 [Gymnopilus junonius]